MHITASVFINDDETGFHDDDKKWLEQLAPFDASPQWYNHTGLAKDVWSMEKLPTVASVA